MLIWIALLLLTLSTRLALGQPLVNQLGYEFSLWITITIIPLFAVTTLYCRTPRNKSVWWPLQSNLLLLLMPLTLAHLAMLRDGCCSWWQSLGFFLLLPVVSTVFITCVAMACYRLTKNHRQALILYFGIVMASLSFTGLRLLFGVTLTAFNPFFGYFPGPIYDATINLEPRLWLYRSLTLLMALWWMGCDRDLLKSLRGRGKPWLRGLTLAIAVLCLAENPLGFYTSREQLKRELGGKISRDSLTIYVDQKLAGSNFNSEYFTDDCEYLIGEISRKLGLSRPPSITLYLYANAERKKRLSGAGRTLIGNPIRRELHLLPISFPDTILTHELTHVLVAPWGVPVLGLGRTPALMEGLATAMEEHRGRYSLDLWAKAILMDSKSSPPLLELLQGFGFFKFAAAKSYALAGSFVNYLIESQGNHKFQQLYRSGDYLSVYGKNLEQLIEAWSEKIDLQKVTPQIQAEMFPTLVRPGIFEERCSHESARLREHGFNHLDADCFIRSLQISGGASSDYAGLALTMLHGSRPTTKLGTYAISALLRKRNEYLAVAWRLLGYLALEYHLPQLALASTVQAQKIGTDLDAYLTERLIREGRNELAKQFIRALSQEKVAMVKEAALKLGSPPSLRLWLGLRGTPVTDNIWLAKQEGQGLPVAIDQLRLERLGSSYFRQGDFAAARKAFAVYPDLPANQLWLRRIPVRPAKVF